MSLRKSRLALAAVIGLGLLSCNDLPTAPLVEAAPARLDVAESVPEVVISQIYGGGGNSGATYRNDFIELFNPGTAAVSLAGWSVQYASAAGSTWQVTALAGTLEPGRYYLVQQAAGAGGSTDLPTPDATGGINMSATAGKVWLVRTTTALSGTCPSGAALVDKVSFGTTATNCDFGTTANLSNTTAALRNDGGCAYTQSLAADFSTGAPNPRNTSAPAHSCGAQGEPATVEVAPASADVMVGGIAAFAATARDEDDNVVSTTFTWSSDDETVATVDATGNATGVAVGTAVITATAANGVSGSATLNVAAAPPPGGSGVVISQIYGGGGNAGSVYTNDFIELFNPTGEAVNLSGWRVWYASAAGTTWQSTELSGAIQPGRYYLVQQAAGAGGTTPLPAPDAAGGIAMAAGAGKVVLTLPGTVLSGACPSGNGIADRVGYGSNATANGCASEWGGRTADLSNTTAAFRRNDGCLNTGSVPADFVVLAANPRNSASPQRSCTQPERPRSDATLVINELMGDPVNAENASWGQWFEVHNHGTTPIDLMGWTIVTEGTSQPNHVIGSSVIVPAGGFAVLGRGADITRNGGVALDYNYFVGNATTIWLDAIDLLMLLDPQGGVADSVAWTGLPRGATRALRDHTQPRADVDGPNWGYSTTTFGDGDYGTPGAVNGTLANEPPFVSPNTITISGRTSSDAPLPVGFEAQLFATLRDPANQIIETTFTWLALTPAIASIDERGVIHGVSAGTARFRATAAEGTFRNHSVIIETPIASATAEYLNSTEFGDPTDNDPSDDFILRRPQFTTSWNGGRGIPNWVAYNLNTTHIVAGQDRCNCFTFDPLLEAAGFQRYNTADYTGVGGSMPFHGYPIDRGHLVRSFDRTSGTLDNALTFYFSNVVPQASDLNQGPWAVMENYLGDLARLHDREVYVYAGVTGSKGTVKNEGRITIPEWNWKVAVVMPRGMGLQDVEDYRDLEVVAVVMPNDPGIRNVNWETAYRVLADSVEKLSGYRLLTALPGNIQRAVKTGTQPPIAKANGPYLTSEDDPVTMSGAASVDPNGTITGYVWELGDGTVRHGTTITHTYSLSGEYTVRLIVTDNDGLVDTATTVAQVNRIPAPAALQNLVTLVNGYVTDGTLNSGLGRSLTAKLLAAAKQLESDNVTSCVNQIESFSSEVEALAQAGRLPGDVAANLQFLSNRLVRTITGG